jgi:pimeloyl-ACP methyl ester carboxylesterase
MNRFLFLCVFFAMALASSPLFAAQSTATAAEPEARKPWYELGMSDPILDQVLLFYLGEAVTGMTDIGECLEAASRIDKDDSWSWALEWEKTADRLTKRATEAEAGKDLRTAGQSYLRAASYYRASAHRHPEPKGEHMVKMAREARRCYCRALELLPELGGKPVRIPYEGTSLPGYFFKAPGVKGKAPAIIVQQGRDAWAQDCLGVAREANARGIDCLLFDGPGQGETIRLQGLPFRPDWEKVIGPVVDWLQRQKGVDPSRIGAIGMSMGGYLIPRAAEREPRLKAIVANPGVIDWSSTVTDYLDRSLPDLMRLLDSDPAAFDAGMAKVMEQSAFFSWAMNDMEWRHGVSSPSALVKAMRDFDARPEAGAIKARTLVIDGDAEEFGQASALYDALRCDKDYLKFSARDAAELHVQVGATAFATPRIMDWMERHL